MASGSHASRAHWLTKLTYFREDNVFGNSGILSTNICIHRLHDDSVEAQKGWDYDGSDPEYLVLMKTPPREEAKEPEGFWATLGDIFGQTAKAMSAPRIKIRWDEIEDIVRANRRRR